jgi:hypothetical protein
MTADEERLAFTTEQLAFRRVVHTKLLNIRQPDAALFGGWRGGAEIFSEESPVAEEPAVLALKKVHGVLADPEPAPSSKIRIMENPAPVPRQQFLLLMGCEVEPVGEGKPDLVVQRDRWTRELRALSPIFSSYMLVEEVRREMPSQKIKSVSYDMVAAPHVGRS